MIRIRTVSFRWIVILSLGVLLLSPGLMASWDGHSDIPQQHTVEQSDFAHTLYVSSNGGSFNDMGKQAAASNLNVPCDGACSPEGQAYFVDRDQGTVFRIGTYGAEPIAEVAHPESLAFDADGHLYVVANDGIYAIPNGEATDAPVHVSSHHFGQPGGIVVLAAGPYAGDILAVDQDADRVWRFPRPSAASFDLATPEAFIHSGLDRPIGIAVDSAGDVYVGNFNSKRILQYGPDGAHKGMLGSDVDLRLNRPIHLEFDDADNLFMASWGDYIGDGWVSMFNPTTNEFRFVGPLIDAWGLTVCRAP